MPFTSETAIYGGTKKGAGRPRKSITDAKQQAAAVVRRILEKNAGALATHYVKRTKKSDHVLCHAIDKLVPTEKVTDASGNTFIQFQFGTESDLSVGLQEEGQQRNINGRAIYIVGDESAGK